MLQFCGLIIMKIILNKEDIEKIITDKFHIPGGWKDDGTYEMDELLDKFNSKASNDNLIYDPTSYISKPNLFSSLFPNRGLR